MRFSSFAGSRRLRSHTPMSQSEADGALGPLEHPDSEIEEFYCQCVKTGLPTLSL